MLPCLFVPTFCSLHSRIVSLASAGLASGNSLFSMLHMSQPLKPYALRPGDGVRVISLASPVKEDRVMLGCEELSRLGYVPQLDREKRAFAF